jgi:UDP-N-acetylmuramate--alanine ligase
MFAPSELLEKDPNHCFFAGVAGVGMSALAQFLCQCGYSVAGTDRLFSQVMDHPWKQKLLEAGVQVLPDESTLPQSHQKLIVSTAIEETHPLIVHALAHKIPVFHRSQVLQVLAKRFQSIAVAGTSGKSTVTGMIFHIMQTCGLNPSFIGGAGLIDLQQKGLLGNAWKGEGPFLVFEADESDGSLVRYAPHISILLNVDQDHHPIPTLLQWFETLKNQSNVFITHSDDPVAAKLTSQNAYNFGSKSSCGFIYSDFQTHGFHSTFKINDVLVELPLPGHHNIQNASAAIAATHLLTQHPITQLAHAMASYKGIYRRHQIIGTTTDGFTLVDDYAHNPAKIMAAIQSCQVSEVGILAWFQPHGFAPTRFMRKELVELLKKTMRPQDSICFSDIFYAGGTVQRDVSSKDLVQDLLAQGVQASYVPNRSHLPQWISSCRQQKPRSCLLLMGARDPSLEDFAQEIATSLKLA